jgi:hypothetical protein
MPKRSKISTFKTSIYGTIQAVEPKTQGNGENGIAKREISRTDGRNIAVSEAKL